MKVAFIEVRSDEPVELPEKFVAQLPKKVLLFACVQFQHQRQSVAQQLKDKGIEVLTARPAHAHHAGQILGCSTEDWSSLGAQACVFLGDGLFHPMALLWNNDLPVHAYDPATRTAKVMNTRDIERIRRARKAGLAAFHAAAKVGVLVTTKYGQARPRLVETLREQYPDKTFYVLLADTFDPATLEDFPFVEAFVNTACPRMMDEHGKFPRPVVNVEDLGVEW